MPDPKDEICRMHQESFSHADPPVISIPRQCAHVQHLNRESLDDGCLLLSLAVYTCVCVLTRYLREHIFYYLCLYLKTTLHRPLGKWGSIFQLHISFLPTENCGGGRSGGFSLRVLQGPFLISSFKMLWFYIPSKIKLQV